MSAAMYPTGSTVTIEEWLVGDVFLKNVYSVFDFSSSTTRIGFAQLGSGGNNASTPTGHMGNAGVASLNSPKTLALILQAMSVVILSTLFATL